jgi:hypothetical protein
MARNLAIPAKADGTIADQMREKNKNCEAKLGLNGEKRPAPQRNTTAGFETPNALDMSQQA